MRQVAALKGLIRVSTCILAVLVLGGCAPTQPMTVAVTKACPLCSRALGTKQDSFRVRMSDASIKALGLREYRGACAYSAAYTANWMLESLKLGKHNLSIVTLGDTCDSCANARIPVHVGTTKVCGICGKHFGGAIELKKIVRREITSDTVKLMPGDCGSRACLLKKKHPDWTLLDCSTIADRKVQIGMSEEQVIASWGRPRDINRTVTAAGVSAQWVYHDFGPYLYFDDGVLTSIQD